MKANLVFTLIQYVLVGIIIVYYLRYGLGDALRITIALCIFTIVRFLFKYVPDKKNAWKVCIPVIIALLPIIVLLIMKKMLQP